MAILAADFVSQHRGTYGSFFSASQPSSQTSGDHAARSEQEGIEVVTGVVVSQPLLIFAGEFPLARLEGLEPPVGCLEENQEAGPSPRTCSSETCERSRAPPVTGAAQVGGGTYVARNRAGFDLISTLAL